MTRDEAMLELATRMELPDPESFAPYEDVVDCDALIDWMVSEDWEFNLVTLTIMKQNMVVFSNAFGNTLRRFYDWTKRHEVITLCACEALGIECDE